MECKNACWLLVDIEEGYSKFESSKKMNILGIKINILILCVQVNILISFTINLGGTKKVPLMEKNYLHIRIQHKYPIRIRYFACAQEKSLLIFPGIIIIFYLCIVRYWFFQYWRWKSFTFNEVEKVKYRNIMVLSSLFQKYTRADNKNCITLDFSISSFF